MAFRSAEHAPWPPDHSEKNAAGLLDALEARLGDPSHLPYYHVQTIYVEETVAHHPRTQATLARFSDAQRIPCKHYGEVFNRAAQNFRHKAPAVSDPGRKARTASAPTPSRIRHRQSDELLFFPYAELLRLPILFSTGHAEAPTW